MKEKPFRYLDDVPEKKVPTPSKTEAARLLGLGKPAPKKAVPAVKKAVPAPKKAVSAPKPAPRKK